MRKLLSLLAGLLLSQAAQAELVFEQAHVRLMPPMQKNTAAFMKIRNTGEHAVNLIKLSSNMSEKTEFHTHIMQNDMMMMKKMEQLIIPAGKSVTLESGGNHIMLLNLKKNWTQAGEVEFELWDTQQNRYHVTMPIEAMHHSPQKQHKMEHNPHQHH